MSAMSNHARLPYLEEGKFDEDKRNLNSYKPIRDLGAALLVHLHQI